MSSSNRKPPHDTEGEDSGDGEEGSTGGSKLGKMLVQSYTDTTAPPEMESPKDAQRLADAARPPIKVGSTSIAERENPDDLYQKVAYREESDYAIGEGLEEGGASLGLEQHPTLPVRDGMPATRLSKFYAKQKDKLEREAKSRKLKEELVLKAALKNKPGLKLRQRYAPKEAPRSRPRAGYTPPRPAGF